jgi:hypothetical protein
MSQDFLPKEVVFRWEGIGTLGERQRELQEVNESDDIKNHKMRELIVMSGKNPRTESYSLIECATQVQGRSMNDYTE